MEIKRMRYERLQTLSELIAETLKDHEERLTKLEDYTLATIDIRQGCDGVGNDDSEPEGIKCDSCGTVLKYPETYMGGRCPSCRMSIFSDPHPTCPPAPKKD